MSNNEEILAMLDDLNMYVYPPAPHTDKTPEESSEDDLEATNGGTNCMHCPEAYTSITLHETA